MVPAEGMKARKCHICGKLTSEPGEGYCSFPHQMVPDQEVAPGMWSWKAAPATPPQPSEEAMTLARFTGAPTEENFRAYALMIDAHVANKLDFVTRERDEARSENNEMGKNVESLEAENNALHVQVDELAGLLENVRRLADKERPTLHYNTVLLMDRELAEIDAALTRYHTSNPPNP